MTQPIRTPTATCESCGQVFYNDTMQTYDAWIFRTLYADGEGHTSGKGVDVPCAPEYIIVGPCCRDKLVQCWNDFVKQVRSK